MQIRPSNIMRVLNAMFRKECATAIAVIAFACFFLCAQRVNAQVIDYSAGFADHSNLTANGSTSWPSYTFGSLGRITNATSQAGNFWSNTRVNITTFTTTFTFDLNDAKAFDFADGLMIVFHNDPRGLMAAGPGGGGLGYGHDSPGPIDPLAIVNSVGVKFDTFMGNPCEVSDNATGLFTDGRSPTCPEPGSDDVQVDLNGTGIDLHRDRNPMQATLSYDGATLTETIANLTTGASFTQTYPVDIAAHVMDTMAYVGFSGGTGGAAEVTDIESWTGTFGP